MIKVGIISDTHNILREEVLNELQSCDYIVHGGDIIDEKILDKLRSISQVFIVKGNNDYLDLNEELYFQIGTYNFYMIHELGEKKMLIFIFMDILIKSLVITKEKLYILIQAAAVRSGFHYH